MSNIVPKNEVTSPSGLMNFLEGAYDKVTGSLPVVGSAAELANQYKKPHKSLHSCVDSLIRWQCSKTASAGFLMGLGGLLTMPVTLPADLAQSWYIQLRMVAAIAHIYENDIYEDKLKTMCIMCLCGKGVQNILNEVAKKTGEAVAKKAIKNISKEVIIAINKAVGCRLITKAGQTGVVNLTKMVPLVGGVIGGTFNGVSTYTVGKVAKSYFKSEYEERLGINRK